VKLLAAYLFLLCAAMPAAAATCGTVLNPVLITVSSVAFGPYSPGDMTGDQANGSIGVTCTVTLSSALPNFTIALNGGLANQLNSRVMSFLGNNLQYNLYTTGSYATIWGDGTTSTQTQSYTAGAASTSYTVYGLIPNHQFLPIGLYLDTITVTVTY
jgi:spore coat protein U-like protein